MPQATSPAPTPPCPLTLEQVKARLYPAASVSTKEHMAELDSWASKTHPERDSLTFWTPGYRGPTMVLHNDHTPASLAKVRGDACSLCGAELGPRRSALEWRAMNRAESGAALAALDRAWAAHLCNLVASYPSRYGITEA